MSMIIHFFSDSPFMKSGQFILWTAQSAVRITGDQDLSVCHLSKFSQDHREGGLPD